MKQFEFSLFEEEVKKINEYTSKIKTPIYEPKNKKPHILELLNNFKSNRLIDKINASNVSEEEKHFLREASRRHYIFNYRLIADYYSHAEPEMQKLMEQSALVIIDFKSAIRGGYVKLSKEIAELWFQEYGHTDDEKEKPKEEEKKIVKPDLTYPSEVLPGDTIIKTVVPPLDLPPPREDLFAEEEMSEEEEMMREQQNQKRNEK